MSYTVSVMPKKSNKTSIWLKIKSAKLEQALPIILIICGVIGLWASFTLVVDHISLIKNPNQSFICDLNPVLSCGSVMQSKTATVLGFPNPLMGLASFTAMIFLGVVMLAGAKMKKWFWQLYLLQMVGSLLFMLFLMEQSLFVIKAICIYCLTVWIVLILSSWYTVLFLIENKTIKIKKKYAKWLRFNHGEVLVTIYVILLVLILREFWYFYGPKLGF